MAGCAATACVMAVGAVGVGLAIGAQGIGTDASVVTGAGESLAILLKRSQDGQSSESEGSSYPKVVDPRTGDTIPEPPGDLKVVPEDQRVPWGQSERQAYRNEWDAQGYDIPGGDWEGYDLHHIIPRRYGGTNDFWNIVPVERSVHQQELNPWWSGYGNTPR